MPVTGSLSTFSSHFQRKQVALTGASRSNKSESLVQNPVKIHAMERTILNTASFWKTTHFIMKTGANSAVGGAARKQASAISSDAAVIAPDPTSYDRPKTSALLPSAKQGADGGAGEVAREVAGGVAGGAAGGVAGRDEGSEAAPEAHYYCIQLTRNLGKDWFEGFFDRNGKRHGKGRYTWADGTVGLCNWSNGCCKIFDAECKKRAEAEGQKSRNARTSRAWKSFSTNERKQYWGMCVKCGEACLEFTFKCLNCETGYCKKCEEKKSEEGYKKRRPACKCLIDRNGIAVQIKGAALELNEWKPHVVLELFYQGRRASATIQDLIFIIQFRRKGALNHHVKALCHIGSLDNPIQSQLLDTKEIQEYVKTFPGSKKPPAFIQLEHHWHNPPQPYPKISLNTAEIQPDWSSAFSETKQDVDSLDIKNFHLTPLSIKNELPELLQRRQVEIGTGWSAVNPPKDHCIICGPRPTLIVYMGKFNMNIIRQIFAQKLTKLTGKPFTTAKKGKSIFQQSIASVDVTQLMTAWLNTVQSLERKIKDDDAENEKRIHKMKSLRIIYHGWKSLPEEIDQFPQTDDSSDDLWNRCKEGRQEAIDRSGSEETSDFEATFDLAQKYVLTRHSELTQETCMSHVRVPVFGILKPIPGFQAETWSMFGPLPPGTIDTGSIKLDRTGPDIGIFPINVKRVKIYPGFVNFLKHFMNQGINGKTLTKKRLDSIRNKFTSILAEISGPKCMQHADMLVSFRIEFTMALNESHKNLQSLRDQLQPLKDELLKKLQPFLKSSIIALEDIQMFSQWCLSRYNKICRGDSNTPFFDQLLARHVVLSLWHGVGYHQFRFTQRKHKDYLVDLDMTGYDTDDDDNDESVAKHAQRKIDWSIETATAIETIMQALQYMNIINVATENKGPRLRYMYRRVCDFDHNTTPCHWCYSEKACKNVAEHPEKQSIRKKSKYACKSKDFDTSIELAEDVYERLKHHHDISSNGCMELMQSMFVAARERTKEQKKVLKDMAELLKIKCPKYNQELVKEFDKSDEGNQDASLSKCGNHRKHFDWSQLTHDNMKTILQALTYMNIFKPKRKVQKQNAKNGSELLSQPDPLQYMYKKVCDVQTGIETCSWCYSDAACKNKPKNQNLGDSQSQKRIVACKSNSFESADALIEDVCGRLQHHHNNLCSDDWNRSLKEMLFPIQEKNKHVQENVLNVMHQKIQKALNGQSNEQCRADLSVDDVDEDRDPSIAIVVTDNSEKHGQGWEIDDPEEPGWPIKFKSSEKALTQLCREMGIPVDVDALPDSWKRPEQCSSYIKLNDCIYSSQPFAKGNAECHVGWSPGTKTPLCVKVVPKKDDDTELEMLQKVQRHTGGRPVKQNLVQFIGHEDQGTERFLKFELVEPRNCFKKDLGSLKPGQVTVYMRELLRALTYLHKNCSIIHRDVKPDNFVHHFDSGTFRLIDFGSAEYYNQTATKFKKGGGTRGFRAPEKLNQRKTKDTPAVDVWSAGMILLSLLTGITNILSHQGHKIPGEKCDETHLKEIGIIVGDEEMRKLNVACNCDYGKGCQYAQKTGWSAKVLQNVNSKRTWTPDDQALDLLSKMLQVLPSQRITSEAALNHPFLNEDNRVASGTSNAVAAEVHELPQQQQQQPPLQRDSESASKSATGLPNGGQWCYLNSVLQCLRHATALTSQISSTSKTYQLITNDPGFGIAHRLRRFLTSNTDILQELTALRRQLRTFDKKFDGTSNECASEVCQTILNAMLTAHCPTSHCQKSPARVAIYGTKATMKCRTCTQEWEGITDDGTVISMALASDNTLQSSIEAWLQYNPLDNVQCANESCDAMIVDRKWNLDTAPDVMIIALNMQYSKDGEKQLNPAHSGDTVDVDKHRYEIFGVVSHIGRTRENGHYIAHTKRNGNWNCFDDSIVISNKHWLSTLKQHETPCMFFLRNIPREESQQCSHQHKTSKPNDSLFVVNGSPSMADDLHIAGNKNAEVSYSLIADESNQQSPLQQEQQDQFIGTYNESAVQIRSEKVTGIIQDPTLAIGKNVLARRDAQSQWSQAYVQDCKGNNCKVTFLSDCEEHWVTGDNIKKMDWKYWNTEMKSWTYDEFDKAIDGSNIEDDAQGNIVALANLEIGDVVAKRNCLNAFTDKDGRAESKEQCNSILLCVECDNWSLNQNKAVFLVTTKRVQRGEKLAWVYTSQSILSDSKDTVVVITSAASNEQACTGNSDNVNNNESQQMLESRKYCIDKTYMKKVKQHFSKDKSVKLLEALMSYNDTFEARLPKNTKSATALLQASQRNERHSKRSANGERAALNLENESAALGYAESTWTTVEKMINLFDEALGSSIPAYYLDIGSGSLAHCAIAASASGRFLVCDGIEYGSTRFQASQKSLLSAQKSGILKSPCKIVHGDVLTSRDIELSTYNVYSFFDKVCIEVSQQTLQRVILEHFSCNFALGPIMYMTCMGSNELSEALYQLQTKMHPREWNSLTFHNTESMNLTTRFAGQRFKCTLVQVRKMG